MNADYDFEAKGYKAPGDWSRLNDLLPADLSKVERNRLAVDDSKTYVLAVLKAHGVEPGPWDAEAARGRNAREVGGPPDERKPA